jgi:predicted  nucleic acid-binding Zn-ribbon protein
MSNSDPQYGLQKLIIINSGKYSFAELDLSSPVHLSAPNNRGKSTLVNALQFLYVDQLRYMRFGSRDTEDTKRHYFGDDPSFIIFECNTLLGPKCLIAVGQGPLNNYNFQRFVYDGSFNRHDFCDNEERLISFADMRIRLADRNLTEIKPGNLWEVIGNPLSTSNVNSTLPAMNILPIRTRDEYISFRNAYIKLLSLSNVTARELRELLITCHARDITCSKIDVSADHREEFENAEQVENSLLFTRTVSADVKRGRDLLDTHKNLTKQLHDKSVLISNDVSSIYHQIQALETASEREKYEIGIKLKSLTSQLEQLNQKIGSIDTTISTQQKRIDKLENLHRKWSTSSEEMIASMRNNYLDLRKQITQLSDYIERAEKLDIDTIRRNTKSIDDKLKRSQRILSNWDTRSLNKLRQMNFSDNEIKQLFQILNPGLADLAIGTDIHINDIHSLKKELNYFTSHINDNKYNDSALQIDLAHLTNNLDMTNKTRVELELDIKAMKMDLDEAKRRLDVAENHKKAVENLAETETDYKKIENQIREYDEYTFEWSNRQKLHDELNLLIDKRQAINNEKIQAEIQQQKLQTRQTKLQEIQRSCSNERSNMEVLVNGYNNLHDTAALNDAHIKPEYSEPSNLQKTESWETVHQALEKCTKEINDLKSNADKIKSINYNIQQLQKSIIAQSQNFKAQTVYFSDSEDDWSRLVEMVDSLSEQENVVEKAWASLFTRLGAKLNGIKQGVAAIRQAVNAINRGLANYHVSNLKSVKLEVILQHETYDLIETLTYEDNIFRDPEKIDRAKSQMRQWITEGEIIQLDELFAIHIKVHDLDRNRPTEAKDLDAIGSTGTGMTAKAMIFIQLVKAIVSQDNYILHFYMDETGQLDEKNLYATTSMAVSNGVMPITADPDVRIEPLAHPTVTVYSLGQNEQGKFYVDGKRTCCGIRKADTKENITI